MQGEFLLSGPGGLGVFVSAKGFSERPPIHFTDYVSSLVFRHPYILALNKQGILVYR